MHALRRSKREPQSALPLEVFALGARCRLCSRWSCRSTLAASRQLSSSPSGSTVNRTRADCQPQACTMVGVHGGSRGEGLLSRSGATHQQAHKSLHEREAHPPSLPRVPSRRRNTLSALVQLQHTRSSSRLGVAARSGGHHRWAASGTLSSCVRPSVRAPDGPDGAFLRGEGCYGKEI